MTPGVLSLAATRVGLQINGTEPDPIGQNIGAGSSIDWAGTASISMPTDNTDNQNVCEGKSVGLTFTAN